MSPAEKEGKMKEIITPQSILNGLESEILRIIRKYQKGEFPLSNVAILSCLDRITTFIEIEVTEIEVSPDES